MSLTLNARTLRFALIALFAAGGLLVWGELAPVDGHVSFRIPPKVQSPQGTILRQDVRSLRLRVNDDQGQSIAYAELNLDAMLQSPVTPPLFLRLPRGEYGLRVTLSADKARSVTLPARLELTKEGYHRVDLPRAP